MKEPTEKDLEKWINKQFEIAWHSVIYQDVKWKENDLWYTKYTISLEWEKRFKEYLKKELKPFVFPLRLDREVSMFVLNFGLRTEEKSI